MIVTQIIESFKIKQERNWEKVYYLFDIHGTILKPSYTNDNNHEFYPFAKEALQLICKRNDICPIMWTCSHIEKINEFIEFFDNNDIFFHYVNENPEMKDNEIASFKDKLYCNVGFDDKFGFNPDEWKQVLFHFQQLK